MSNVLFLIAAPRPNNDNQLHNGILRITKFCTEYEPTTGSDGILSHIAIPALGEYSIEAWQTGDNEPVESFSEADAKFARSAGQTFIRIALAETDARDLTQVSFSAYQTLFASIQKYQLGNLARIWNYIPRILSGSGDLERYRQFNLGRWNAWEQFGPKHADGLPKRPAATGIGSFDGPLVIEALCTQHPVTYLENPRQAQFVHYSRKWGPKPPVSARGTLHLTPQGTELLIAGTASLVGEEVTHEGDVSGQTHETLHNIEVLIGQENLATYGQKTGFSLEDVRGVRVYIKNSQDYPTIRAIIEETWPDQPILYLHDEICRPGFLVEIEGIANKQ